MKILPLAGPGRMLWPMLGAAFPSRLCAALLIAACGWLAGAARAQGARASANRVDYTIDVTVDTATMRLVGRETVRFANHSGVATSELWFHLYWNAFANNRSTLMTEAAGSPRSSKLDAGWGWQRVTSLHAQGEDLTGALSFEHPDDDNVEDRSVIKVVLPRAVESGEALEIALEWEAQIPRLQRRTGYKGNFLFIAQWFPKLGVFEGARGWNCHQFHASTEFFSDYGSYDVTIDLPVEYENKIGASGKSEPPSRSGGRVRTRFLAPDPIDQQRVDATGKQALVHDFAWTADPDFKRFRGTFSYEEWRTKYSRDVDRVRAALGAEKSLQLRSVDVTVLIQPEHEEQWERHVKATCAALFFYGLWWGEYPYSHVTCVDPAWGGGAAGGMEYPTLFTAGTRVGSTRAMHSPEGVTVHECGHQFWYGLVGNNEFEAAWLDEGFNSFGDGETLSRVYKRRSATSDYSGLPFSGVAPSPLPSADALGALLSAQRIHVPLFGVDLTPVRSSGFVNWWRDQPRLTFVDEWTDPRAEDRGGYLADPDRDPVDRPAFRYVDRRSYRTNSYPRTAVILRSLPAVVGEQAFLRGMRHYAEEWRYRHPYAQDFFDSFCAGAGVDVHWYFEELFRGTGTVDWSVSVEQRRRAPAEGLFQSEPAAEFVATQREDAVAPADGAVRAEAEQPWEAEVLIVRRGELRLPLEIELRYDDKTSERVVWTREAQADGRWWKLERSGTKQLVGVVLDPDGLYFLDTDLSNNRWFDERDVLAPWRWSERAFQRNLQLLHWQAGLGG